MKVALLSTALALAACNQHVVTYDTSLPRGKVHSEWTGHYLYGSIGHTDINVRRICPEGAAKIETYRSFGNGMIGALTLGIYTPRTVRITCVSGNTAIAALSEEGKIAYDSFVNRMVAVQTDNTITPKSITIHCGPHDRPMPQEPAAPPAAPMPAPSAGAPGAG